MAVSRAKKEALREGYEQSLVDAPHAFLIGFRGISVAQVTELRRRIRPLTRFACGLAGRARSHRHAAERADHFVRRRQIGRMRDADQDHLGSGERVRRLARLFEALEQHLPETRQQRHREPFAKRARAPFLTVPCGAIPANLVESTFFGHTKGAFTGATDRKVGKFEAAGAGTILLDEIDTLGLEQQASLLRVIETGEFEPVGTRPSHQRMGLGKAILLRGLAKMRERGMTKGIVVSALSRSLILVTPAEIPASASERRLCTPLERVFRRLASWVALSRTEVRRL